MSRLSSAFAILAVALAPLGLGCYATVGGYADAEYVEADYVPPDVEVYPHYDYGGRVVYLINDRWYYRRGPHWVYYREEPRDLYRYRQRAYVQRAPRAPERRYERREPVRRAPPRHQEHREVHRRYAHPVEHHD